MLGLLSSIASLVDSDVRAEDSQDLLEVFMGTSEKGREELIIEATTRTALRKGDWVLIPPYKGAAVNKLVDIELGNSKKSHSNSQSYPYHIYHPFFHILYKML